ncbi:ABC transporter permease [Propionispora vibrioides]|uniref:Monosaccharide ABC transporter membrane protein, CUT2 family n=1 Tax=Propionispora vibrioides TaxID=112903 RepID=A0A1H8WUV6_9FIRM|nr:ABC transporter permease [Propionispora vibrioides]SEP31409.1 monosaccharide ABC transporter membrane protein, CUT2 family [Propionispora vibrioides]
MLKWDHITQKIETDKLGLIVALVALVIIFSFFNSNYLSSANLINILVAASLPGLVAIGETYLIIAGLCDLSTGSVAAFASVLAAVLMQKGLSFFPMLLVVIGAGILVGYINAWAVNKIKLESFIATLATMSIFRGFAYIICDGKPVYIMDSTFIDFGKERMLGLPIPVIILLLAFLLFGIILAKTRFGRSVYVVGGSKNAARLAGLDPERITNVLFMLTGALSALGGIILGARMSSGQPAASVGLEFDAITAAVLGGTAFTGGVGTIFGTVLGVLILQGFNTGLIMLNVPVFWQFVARGMLLFIALAFDFLRKKNREKKLLEQSMALLEQKEPPVKTTPA